MRLAQRFGLLIGLATGLSVVGLIVVVALLFSQMNSRVSHSIEQDGRASLAEVILMMKTVCSTQDELLRLKIESDLNVATDHLVSHGGARITSELEPWTITNQFTKASSQVDLPRLNLGDQWFGKHSSLNDQVPLVDDVKALVGGTCTVFQRINEEGDMLRVATNVAKLDGTRAIGTYIPARNPDGKPNAVVATLLRGETFRGRAYVVNDWYLTAYKPIKDDTGRVVGALYVGSRIESIASVRQAIRDAVVGKTGESFVAIGDHFLIAPSWATQGHPVSEVLQADGTPRYRELLSKAQAEPGIQTAHVSNQNGDHHLVAAVRYEPWDWVIFCELPEQDIMSSMDAVETAEANLMFWLPVSGVGILVTTIVIGYVVAAWFARPVQQVASSLEEIAEGEGDLTRRLPVVGGPEERALASGFNSFANTVHDILVQVRRMSEIVSTGTSEISQTSQQLVQDMSEQQRHVETTSAAVEELSNSADSVAVRTGEAAGLATQAGDVAKESGETLGKTIHNLETIRDSVGAAAEAVGLLGERGTKIGEIIQVINDIADQTNLLALNAAIEAARAGEHGRGFAVVADEVRKLADRTTKATSEITESIEGMQTETETSVEKISLGSQQAKDGAREADHARGSLDRIMESASSVGRLVTDIAAAAKEQSQASKDISSSVETITRTSVQAREFSGRVSSTSQNLADNARQLSGLVSRFKLNDA